MTWEELLNDFKRYDGDDEFHIAQREALKAFADELVKRRAGIPVTEEGIAIINCMNEMLHEAGVEL